MNDERLASRLRATEGPVTPDPAFLDRMYRQLADELGFDVALGATAGPTSLDDRRARRVWSTRRRLGLLLLAATLAILAAGGALIVGSALLRHPDPQVDDLFDRLLAAGQMRVGVVSSYPQAVAASGSYGGFDVDVANELGRRLGISVDLQVLPAADLLGSDAASWDVALPPTVLTNDQAADLRTVGVSYYWPIQVLVPTGSTATDLASLSGRRVCVPAGTLSEQWLAGHYDAAAIASPRPAPTGVTIVTTKSDANCLDQVASGAADALVTDTLGPADLVVRPSLRSLVGAVLVQPRGPVVRRGPESERLAAELADALEAMRSDGTLTDMSRRRFGADLTAPPAP